MKHHSIDIFPLIAAIAVSAAVLSCSKEQKENTINSQEESISKYIEGSLKDYEVIRRNGSNRVIVDAGYGADTLSYGDSLYFYYAGYVFSNGPSKLFSTNVQSVAEKSNFNITEQEHTYDEYGVLFDEGCFISGLTEGLFGVREGEHAVIIFSARYGFYDKPVANVPALSPLLYEVWINEIKKNQ